VERRPNFDLWLSGVGNAAYGYMLENPHSCKDTRMAPPLDVLQGHVTGDYVIKACDTCDMTCEHVSRQGELWSFFPFALDLSVSVGFYTVSISNDFKQSV